VWQKDQSLSLKGPYLHLSNNKCPEGKAKTWKEQQDGAFKEHPSFSSEPHQLLFIKDGFTVLQSIGEPTPIISTGEGIVNNRQSVLSGRLFMQINGKERTFEFPADTGSTLPFKKQVDDLPAPKKRLVPQLQVYKDGKCLTTLDYHDFLSLKEGYLISQEDSVTVAKQDVAGKFVAFQTITPPKDTGIFVDKVVHRGNFLFANFVHKETKNSFIDIGTKKARDKQFVSISNLFGEKLLAAQGNRIFTSVPGKSTLIVRETSNISNGLV
ncbi:MAG: hypothetical protein HYX67_08755, partial [Candidatus Melainabacteria bacterium]|nr:hypothetical protein [Candidatus Melainabacteria bacterium]